MSLPIIIIFENHWHQIPKLFVQDCLPDLVKQGYDTFCFEAPQDLTLEETISGVSSKNKEVSDILKDAENLLRSRKIDVGCPLHKIPFSKLTELMRLYVSSKKYIDVAEMIKSLPSSRLLQEIITTDAERLSIKVKGVDVNSTDYSQMIDGNCTERMPKIDKMESIRIDTMFKNLSKAREEGGLVFICGAAHADNLIGKFKKEGLERDVLYYFLPEKNAEAEFEMVMGLYTEGVLKGHTYEVSTIQELEPLKTKIIKKIFAKREYRQELPEGNSHSRLLTAFFKVPFRAFVRSGHVDALLDVKDMDAETVTSIKEQLSKKEIPTVFYSKRKILVIPNINTREIAENIRRL